MLSEMANLITNKQHSDTNYLASNQSNSRSINSYNPRPPFSQHPTAMKRPNGSVDISESDVHQPQSKKIRFNDDVQTILMPKNLPVDSYCHLTPTRLEDLSASSGTDSRQISDSLLTLVDDNSQECSRNFKIIFDEDLQEAQEVADMLLAPYLSEGTQHLSEHHSKSNQTVRPVL